MLQSVELVQRHSTGNERIFVFKEVAATLDVVPNEVPLLHNNVGVQL